MAVADSSYALEQAATADLLSPEVTVAPSVVGDPASFRRIGVGVLVLVTTVELFWVGLLLFAVLRFV